MYTLEIIGEDFIFANLRENKVLTNKKCFTVVSPCNSNLTAMFKENFPRLLGPFKVAVDKLWLR